MAEISSGHFYIIQFIINIVTVNIAVTEQIRNLEKGWMKNFLLPLTSFENLYITIQIHTL
ncbi:hypothetical protein C8J95_102217 [Elizabethkingia sp. YR214]|nr:hypothetical protein C8J95_102217 [Elizabethkingia sp. YR214]